MTLGAVAHWLTLAFTRDDLEETFLREHAAKSVVQARVAAAMAVALYAGFGALDAAIIPDARPFAWLIRFGVVCPLWGLYLALTFWSGFPRLMQPLGAALGFVSGAGIVAMIAVAGRPGSDLYYAGLLLVSAFVTTFLRLRFWVAALTCWSLTGLYAAVLALGSTAPVALLVNNLTFLAAINVICMSAGYAMERSARDDFLQRRLIADQAGSLAEALSRVKVLKGLLPICAWCRKVRDDRGYWRQIESYVSAHTDASFSHGMCPDCADRLEREYQGDDPADAS